MSESPDSTARPVALVTGSGAPRVGRAVAAELAERGYAVVVHAHRSADAAQEFVDELNTAGHPALAVTANVAREDQVRQMVEQTLAHFGRIDALVNCAAIWEPKPLEQVSADDVRRHFDINTLGTFLCCQQVGLHMVAQETGGAIVNVGDWAIVRTYRDYAGYFPSKGAIPTLTRNLAVELGIRNPRVRVNAILPGPVMLPDDMPQEERDEVIAETLVKREGSPENVAHAVAFLLENDFVTGACIPVDGGRTVYAPQSVEYRS